MRRKENPEGKGRNGLPEDTAPSRRRMGDVNRAGQEIKPGWGLRSGRDPTGCFLFILHKLILKGEAYLESCPVNTGIQPQARSQDILESMPGSSPGAGLKRWEPGEDEVDWRLKNSFRGCAPWTPRWGIRRPSVSPPQAAVGFRRERIRARRGGGSGRLGARAARRRWSSCRDGSGRLEPRSPEIRAWSSVNNTKPTAMLWSN